MSELVRKIEASRRLKRVLRERVQQCNRSVFFAKLARKTQSTRKAESTFSAFATNSWSLRLAEKTKLNFALTSRQ